MFLSRFEVHSWKPKIESWHWSMDIRYSQILNRSRSEATLFPQEKTVLPYFSPPREPGWWSIWISDNNNILPVPVPASPYLLVVMRKRKIEKVIRSYYHPMVLTCSGLQVQWNRAIIFHHSLGLLCPSLACLSLLWWRSSQPLLVK